MAKSFLPAFPGDKNGCLPAACVHIVIDLRGVVVVDGGGCVKQHRQQVLLHVANFRGIFLQTVHDKLDMGLSSFKTGTHDLVGKSAPAIRVVFRLAQTVSTISSTISSRSSR